MRCRPPRTRSRSSWRPAPSSCACAAASPSSPSCRCRPSRSPGEPAPPPPPESDEAATARINLRLPEQLKAGIEQAAARERLSVNAWAVRLLAAAVGGDAPGRRAAPARRRRPIVHRLGPLSTPTPTTSNLNEQENLPMPTFETPEPILAVIDVVVADVRIRAGDRTRRPSRSRPSDPRTPRTSGWRSRPASSTRPRSCWSRRRSCAPGRSAATEDRSTSRSSCRPARACTAAEGWRASTPTARSPSAGSRPGSATSGSTRAETVELRSGTGDIDVGRVTGRAEHQHRVGRRARARAGRRRGDQELQRRHVGRRRRGRAAAQRGQRQHRRREVGRERRGQVGQRRRPARRGGARLRGARVQDGRPRGRHPRGHRGVPGRARHRGPRPQRARQRRRPRGSAETAEVRGRTVVGDILIRRPR